MRFRPALFALLLAFGVVPMAGTVARAQTEAPVVTTAYETTARWLFDLYLNQSIRLTVANSAQKRPDAPAILTPQLAAIARVLERHRADFAAAMGAPLRGQFSAPEIAAFSARLSKPPVDLDEPTRQKLIAVDADFRRDHQRIIRAMTFDLGSIVAEALAAVPVRQN